jgi:uncharacterized 2Fe-2S/4Fe-4S cluster protein (DUF4445 family)
LIPVTDRIEVVFVPSGRRGHFDAGVTVLEAARDLGVDLDSVCGGRGLCGRCQVTQGTNPEIAADPAAFSDPQTTETAYRGRRPLGPDHRLGCAVHILRDAVIDVPPASQVHKQVIRKDAGISILPVDPVVRLHYVEVPAPELSTPTGDLERVLAALADQWDIHDVSVPLGQLRHIQQTLRSGSWKITVAIRNGTELVGSWPGFRDSVFGVAFDVGSTTLAGHLCELNSGTVRSSAGAMNPQIAFGEDVMSRVSHLMMDPGGLPRLVDSVRKGLDGLIGSLCDQAGIDRTDIAEITLVGNPIMHHLVHGIDPTPLGTAPFALATTGAITTDADRLGLDVHPGTQVYALPCIAGHVGADAAAAVLAAGPHRSERLQLLVDVGTNAEIVLGNGRRLLAASSPTGPAFEGAEISAGQRAAPGAIERVRIDSDTLQARFRVIGCELWSDEAGFADATAGTGVTGICGSGIIEAVAEMYLAGILSTDGVIVGRDHPNVPADGRTSRFVLSHDPPISVTQNDVRAIQLAKAALQAGCRLLMDRFGVTSVDEIRLAGAFGSHIDPLHAMVLGMIPDCDLDHVEAVGNAAGIGAMMALLSDTARTEIETITRTIEKIETATESEFQNEFVAAMAFPNATHPYPNLTRVIDLPAPVPVSRSRRRRR